MNDRRQYQFSSNNPFGSVAGILLGILFLLGLFYVANFIFTILYYLSPIMLIGALIIDYKSVLGYGRWLVNTVKRSPVFGIIAIVMTVLAFPLVALFLLGKALLSKRVRQAQEAAEGPRPGEYIEYEELDSEPMDLDPPREPEKQRRSSRDYDDFFDR